jgi:hypothetical protein
LQWVLVVVVMVVSLALPAAAASIQRLPGILPVHERLGFLVPAFGAMRRLLGLMDLTVAGMRRVVQVLLLLLVVVVVVVVVLLLRVSWVAVPRGTAVLRLAGLLVLPVRHALVSVDLVAWAQHRPLLRLLLMVRRVRSAVDGGLCVAVVAGL